MFVKVKAMIFGCCTASQVTDPVEVENKIKFSSKQSKHFSTNLKTENCTMETQGNFLTTTEGDEISCKGPKLRLVALEGDILPINKEFLISGKGLETNEKRRPDGCVYIGRNKQSKENIMHINDIVLDDSSVGEKHCMIKYNKSLKRYYLKDQGDGSGTFVKIQGETKLRNGNIISFSDSHMVVQLTSQRGREDSSGQSHSVSTQGDIEKDTLGLKFLDGPKAGEVYKFTPEQGLVKIGRMSDCQIKFDGTNLSRYQSSIEYKDEIWHISDGIDGKSSTNGTWIFLETFYEIKHGTILKIGQTLFRADIVNLDGIEDEEKK